jgi:hypothetical protein
MNVAGSDRKTARIVLFMALVIFISASTASAATYYVSPAGSASWPSCMNISTPCSAQTAMANAVAGDTIYFRGGQYAVGQSYYPSASLQPSHSGTAESPITFMAYPGETPIINGNVEVKVTGIAGAGSNNTQLVDNNVDFVAAGVAYPDTIRTIDKQGGAWLIESGGVSAHTLTFADYPHNTISLSPGDRYEIGYDSVVVLGNGAQSYIVFDGFTVQANNGLELATFKLWGQDESNRAYGLVARNITNIGHSRNIVHGDNRDGIRIEATVGALLQNCKIYNNRSTQDSWNTAGIKMYHNTDAIIENCEVYNTSAAMYVKSDNINCSFRNNYVHDNYEGFLETHYCAGICRNSDDIKIYNNVFSNNSGVAIQLYGQETSHADNAQIYNNTTYGSGSASCLGYSQGSNFRIWNNIIQGCDNNQYSNGYDSVTVLESDYNNFGSASFTIKTHTYQPTVYYNSLAAWQASTELVGGGHPDLHSLATNPLFTNGSGNYSLLSDFNLQAGSPCKGTGKGGVDMGADISTVGYMACSNLPVRINNATPGYLSVQTAYAAASDGDTIKMQERTFSENLTLDDGLNIKLEGGYNCSFSSNVGYSTISDKIIIGGLGKVKVENLILK